MNIIDKIQVLQSCLNLTVIDRNPTIGVSVVSKKSIWTKEEQDLLKEKLFKLLQEL